MDHVYSPSSQPHSKFSLVSPLSKERPWKGLAELRSLCYHAPIIETGLLQSNEQHDLLNQCLNDVVDSHCRPSFLCWCELIKQTFCGSRAGPCMSVSFTRVIGPNTSAWSIRIPKIGPLTKSPVPLDSTPLAPIETSSCPQAFSHLLPKALPFLPHSYWSFKRHTINITFVRAPLTFTRRDNPLWAQFCHLILNTLLFLQVLYC